MFPGVYAGSHHSYLVRGQFIQKIMTGQWQLPRQLICGYQMKECKKWGNRQGRAGLEGLLAGLSSLLTFRPSFSLMRNLPLLTPTDCTIALGSTQPLCEGKWDLRLSLWAHHLSQQQGGEASPTKPGLVSTQVALESHRHPLHTVHFRHFQESCIRFITPTWSQLTGEWWKLFTWQLVKLMYRGFLKKQTLPVLTNSRQEWEHMERVFYLVGLFPWSSCWGIREDLPIFPFSGKSWITSVPEARAGKKKQR